LTGKKLSIHWPLESQAIKHSVSTMSLGYAQEESRSIVKEMKDQMTNSKD
jgi:hypothetical protein